MRDVNFAALQVKNGSKHISMKYKKKSSYISHIRNGPRPVICPQLINIRFMFHFDSTNNSPLHCLILCVLSLVHDFIIQNTFKPPYYVFIYFILASFIFDRQTLNEAIRRWHHICKPVHQGMSFSYYYNCPEIL